MPDGRHDEYPAKPVDPTRSYGGDISRRKKLRSKQREGKKPMKQIGRVEVPKEAFLAVLELGDR